MARGLLSLVLWGLISVQVVLAVEAEQQAKLVSSVSVEGLVFCDQCLQDKVTRSSNLLNGAKVAVVCESKSAEATTPVEVVATTDSKGQFKAELPKSAFDHDGQISCAAELRESPRRSCKLLGISRRTSSAFNRLDTSSAAITYAAGALSFHPKSAGLFCAQASYYSSPGYSPPVYTSPPVYYQSPPVYQSPPYYQSPPVYQQQSPPPPVYQQQQSPPPPVYQQQSPPPPVYYQPPPVYQQQSPPPRVYYQPPPVYQQQSPPPPVYQQQSPPPPVYQQQPPVYQQQQPPVYQQQSPPPPVYQQQSPPPPVYQQQPPVYKSPKPYYKPRFRFPKFKLPKLSFPKFKWPSPKKGYYPPKRGYYPPKP